MPSGLDDLQKKREREEEANRQFAAQQVVAPEDPPPLSAEQQIALGSDPVGQRLAQGNPLEAASEAPQLGAGQQKLAEQKARGLLGPTQSAATPSLASIPPAPEAPPEERPGVLMRTLQGFFAGLGGRNFEQLQLDKAKIKMARFAAQDRARTRRAEENLQRFQEFVVPALKQIMKPLIKQKQQDAKARGEFFQPGPDTVLEAMQLWNSQNPNQQLGQVDIDTFTDVAAGSMSFFEQGILPLKEGIALKQQGLAQRQQQRQKFIDDTKRELSVTQLFKQQTRGLPFDPSRAGQQTQNLLVPTAFEGGNPLGPPSRRFEITDEFRRIAGAGGQNVDELAALLTGGEQDAQGRFIPPPVTGEPGSAPSIPANRLRLLQSLGQTGDVATKAQAGVPAALAKASAAEQSKFRLAEAQREFQTKQTQIKQDFTVRRATEKEQAQKRLKRFDTIQRAELTYFQDALDTRQNNQRVALQSQATLQQMARQAEIDHARDQEKFGGQAVLQSMRTLAADEQLDKKLIAQNLQTIRGGRGDAATRAVMKELIKAGRVDLVGLAKELATDKPLNKILKDVLIEVDDEINNPVGDRIQEILASKSGPATKDSQLAGLQLRFKNDKKNLQRVKEARQAIKKDRDPFAIGRALNNAINVASKSSGLAAIDPVTGQINVKSLFESKPRDVERYIRSLQTQADANPALAVGLQPLIDDARADQRAIQIERQQFRGVRKELPGINQVIGKGGVTLDNVVDQILDGDIPSRSIRSSTGKEFTIRGGAGGRIVLDANIDGKVLTFELRGKGDQREWIFQPNS